MKRSPLSFSTLDGIAFAAARDRLDNVARNTLYESGALGPLMELRHLCTDGLLPHRPQWLSLGTNDFFDRALGTNRQQWAENSSGFFRIADRWSEEDRDWIGFGLLMQRAATLSGFHRKTAAQFVAATTEMLSNVWEHSGMQGTGIVAFRATQSMFELVVADRGRGILNSLQTNPAYAALRDHGEALRLAITDGISSSGSPGRGMGFRPIFVGLANLTGVLRFRTGDHAYVIDGQKIDRMFAKTAQKVPLKGFFISVACRRPPSHMW